LIVHFTLVMATLTILQSRINDIAAAASACQKGPHCARAPLLGCFRLEEFRLNSALQIVKLTDLEQQR
jgi:hypothetical protein